MDGKQKSDRHELGRSESAASIPFGTLLRTHRIAALLSQEALAERSRMSVDAISALERGTRRAPRRDTVALLVEALRLGEAERVALETAAAGARPSRPRSFAPGGHANADGPDSAYQHNLPLPMTSFYGRDRGAGESGAGSRRATSYDDRRLRGRRQDTTGDRSRLEAARRISRTASTWSSSRR